MSKFHKTMFRKTLRRTDRKLVFVVKTGELQFVRPNKVSHRDMVIDQIFYDEGQF